MWAWAGVLLLALAFPTGAGAAYAQESSPFDIDLGEAASGRPTVRVQNLLRDEGLQDALGSGLPLRFHLRVELWQRGFFDRLVDAEDVFLVLTRDPLDGAYLLEDGQPERRYRTLAQVQRAIETALTVALEPQRRGRFYYLGTLEVETLSLSDLEELRRWLRGQVRPAVEGRSSPGQALERGLRRVFVRVIGLPTRRYEARSQTFRVR